MRRQERKEEGDAYFNIHNTTKRMRIPIFRLQRVKTILFGVGDKESPPALRPVPPI